MAVEVKVTSVAAEGHRRQGRRREGGTVAEVLRPRRQYPGFKQQIMQDGPLHRFVNIYMNDEDIRYLSSSTPR